MTLDEVKMLVQENGIEYFLCSFVEMAGAPKAKVVPATQLEDMAQEGAGFAGYAAGEIGQRPHDPDMASIPDLARLPLCPGVQIWLGWLAMCMLMASRGSTAPGPYCSGN